MNRLQAEQQRLYPAPSADGGVRALVLGLGTADAWQRLGKAWQGVQAELDLPAPGIAVAGNEGYQLWFSLASPVAPAQAAAFLQAVRRRYLADVPADRVAASPPGSAQLVPVEVDEDRWSAFVAPDLAALFADETWLDLPPSSEAQAELLSRLESITSKDFDRALQLLQPTQAEAGPAPSADPRAFLLQVMNDASVDLRLRIEAAKALLPHAEGES